MRQPHRVSMLGTGLIGQFYTRALQNHRSKDDVEVIYSRTEDHASEFADEFNVSSWTTDMDEAIEHPDTDVVVVGLPNHLHEEVIQKVVDAGKAVLCTKPLGRNAEEAYRILQTVEDAGVFSGYLEDIIYTPKTLTSLESVEEGAVGDVMWVRARESHAGPHSSWFWDQDKAGGGAIIDLACHCVEVMRAFVGKEIKPVEAMCWSDTLVHPIEAEDHGIGLVRFENGAVGQFEVSWGFHGGMDLRDEVSGTEGTIWLDHFLRTGFEMFSTGSSEGYVAEKAESDSGWLFPVGDEVGELGYYDMFTDMFDAMDQPDHEPRETFYDGYVVNAILDACYESAESKQWEPVELDDWRGKTGVDKITAELPEHEGKVLVKKERMPDGREKLILKDKETGEISQAIEE